MESNLAKRVDEFLKAQENLWFFNVQGGATQRAGIPDRIVCYRGYFVALELKRPDGTGVVSPRQVIEMRLMNDAGGYTKIVESLDDVKAVLDEVDSDIQDMFDYGR
jgi:hypothetical protein